MTTRTALTRARKLIASPDKWCQGFFENRKGQHCAFGALLDVTGGGPIFERALGQLNAAAREAGEVNVINLNDHRTHAEVLDLFDVAIAEAA